MISKLLCATDGSKASAKAVEFAADFANQLGVGVTFLVIDPITDSDLSNTRGWSHVVLTAIDEQENRELHAAEGVARAKGVKDVEAVSAQGHNIAATIIAYAEENGFEHVVVGSTGKTGISRMMMGSIAAAVVAKAHCPVTVVR